MTVDNAAHMAEGKDPGEFEGGGGGSEFVGIVNGHMSDDEHAAASSSEFAASVLGHPSTILIVTNVADATFVSTEAKVTSLLGTNSILVYPVHGLTFNVPGLINVHTLVSLTSTVTVIASALLVVTQSFHHFILASCLHRYDVLLVMCTQDEFESLFRHYEAGAQFQYLKSFRRARILFQSLESSAAAHQNLFNYEFRGQQIKCYYAQVSLCCM